MYWNQPAETMEREQLRSLQAGRLKELVDRIYRQQPFYRSKMQEQGLLPQDINSLEDIAKLPFTVKQDMRDNYPYGLFAVAPTEIIRIHASSGTTGRPTVVGYTKRDIGIWSEVMARALTGVGVTKQSFVQIAYGYGLFTGGLGVHYGAELIGASVIPISSGNTARQIMLMKDFGTTTIACTPSYALYIAETMREMEIDPRKTSLKVGVFGAEPWSERMRGEIEEQLGIKAVDIYGLSEIIGPGVACECLAQNGLHINEDHFYPEIINPVTGDVLPDGEKGELVLTTLTKDGMPMIRYRTRDLTMLEREVCSCGRTLVRMSKVLGRSDDMLIIRGVNVFPSQVETVLLSIGETSPHYQLIVDRKDNLDCLTVLVEVTDDLFSDEVKRLEALEHKIKSELASALSVSATVRLVGSKTIERSEGKAKRVIDNRKL
ncbi:MAG TPA: phenylacetate--CoA ligase [Methylomusa anaerophila]|uniref:Phenylacetate-coenzyme A ligase n=1 Tax=Methylomusa anaerophila TaxID=1930071 RepID=A0A348AIF6_9FIRM|nr:phenylacetate--CoA ligase [Methylomusa anaerophila]BBB90854.1 phenylacetate-coenzyme A ligase [Methylomusa anaerophila]HML90648.1 phenylacetate--CoA ligase [Methylomusa anaerophila]